MRLLFLTSRLPYPPDRGDRLRAFNFIRSLSQDHEIHLLSFIADDGECDQISPLKEFCRDVQVVPMSTARSALTVGLNIWRDQPLQALYYHSAAMQKRVGSSLAEFDIDAVYVHLFRMAPYVEDQSDLYRIVDLTDVISQELIRSMPYRGLASRLLYTIERPRIERYERWVARHFEETWLISAHDRDVLAANCPDANIQVIRNGVDIERLRPTSGPEIPESLILVGHMGVFHNVDAATFLVNEILPLIRTEIPEVTVKLVGAAPNPQVRELALVPGVQVTGFVDDLNAVLNQSAVFVAPLRFAAGVQNKVLEAMTAGRPVVTTSLVNQGIGAQPGCDLITADDAPSIAAAVIDLLHDQSKRRELGEAGRAFVQEKYSWNLVRQRMREIQESRQ
jgi:sugar transferase (PEP-CTERM/EpsH1 system associated)